MSLEDAQRSLLDGLFTAIDSKDADAFVGFLTSDASFRFGSAPAAQGTEAIQAAVDGFFGTIKGLEHTVSKAFASGTTLFCEGDVTYTRHDDSKVTLPFADVFEMSDDRIADYKIYMDIAPLYTDQ